MLSYIEKIREKPDHHKRRIVALTSGLITAIITLFWIGSFFVPGQLSTTTAENGTSPLSIIRNNLGSAYDSLRSDNNGAFPLVPATSTTNSNVNYNNSPTSTNDPIVTPS